METRSVKRYKIVKASYFEALTDACNELITLNWEPHGSLVVVANSVGDIMYYIQAMINRDC